MKYIKVRWNHHFKDDPILLYSELDEDCFELRKVEIFKNGIYGFACKKYHSNNTRLSDEYPIPSLSEISKDPQFKPYYISKEEFEEVWQKAISSQIIQIYFTDNQIITSIGIWADPLNLGNGHTYAPNNPWTFSDPYGFKADVWQYFWDDTWKTVSSFASDEFSLFSNIGEIGNYAYNDIGGFSYDVGASIVGGIRDLPADFIDKVGGLPTNAYNSIYANDPSQRGTALRNTVEGGLYATAVGGAIYKIGSNLFRSSAKNVAESSVESAIKNSANNKTFYRSMSKAEAEAIKETKLLRGGREGETFFTDSRFRTAERAKDRLSLKDRPEVQMEFKIKNNPKLELNGTKVEPKYGGRGKGKEFMTEESVEVDIINVQPY